MAEIPSALLVEASRFVSLKPQDRPDSSRPTASDLPTVLPETLTKVTPWTGPMSKEGVDPSPTTLFLTIDTEDVYFDRPVLMTGDGVGREWGVFGILDELDMRNLKATFFVNVYEKDAKPAGVLEGVVREIAARGHEVGLHTHQSPTLDFYERPLFDLSESEQAVVLDWGANLIHEWTGDPATSFRAGGYALNDDTFAALERVGLTIDSSCFFPSANNRQTSFTVNSAALHGEVVEMPITSVLRIDNCETLRHSKLDLDWLNVDDLLISALNAMSRHGASFATFMMHSFSFIEKEGRRVGEPPSPHALLTSKDVSGFYVDVYGAKPMARSTFASFLDRVVAEPAVQVRTLRESISELRSIAASSSPDIVPICVRSAA
jgi:peptidoglycan/xylan/chitin deacetylase (PgdA/CDA1 family)